MENSVHAWLNSAGSITAILGLIWIAAVKVTRLEVKVDTMWNFTLRRAVVEGVEKGLLNVSSPVRLTAEAASYLDQLAPELQVWYEKCGKNLNEKDMAIAIEAKYGTQLIHEVCLPNGISFGVCLLIAVAIAKGEHKLTQILDEYDVPKGTNEK